MTTDTPRTDALIWRLTTFNSALLEHDGETCNEIHCASHDEAECLVDLLNEKERELAESHAQSHGLARRVVEAETMLEAAQAKLNDATEWLDERYRALSEADDRAEKAEAEVEMLKKPRYPFESFQQFCDFLTANNIVDELAVEDPERWDGGSSLSKIDYAFDRALDEHNKIFNK